MSLTPARLQNLLIYVLTAMANILAIALAAALAAGTMPGFRDGEMLAPAKTEMAALLAFVIPILSGSSRPTARHSAVRDWRRRRACFVRRATTAMTWSCCRPMMQWRRSPATGRRVPLSPPCKSNNSPTN
jgi:hypothetical protein